MRCANPMCKKDAEDNSNYCEQHSVKGGSKTQLRREGDVPKGKD